MNIADCIFWNVDTQFDFVSPDGKLYVLGAELLKPNWKRLTQLAKSKSITVVNTADWHYSNSAELSSAPNFIKTFPPHCMANTEGAEYIDETTPENPLAVSYTHLDVYKRQVMPVPMPFSSAPPPLPASTSPLAPPRRCANWPSGSVSSWPGCRAAVPKAW